MTNKLERQDIEDAIQDYASSLVNEYIECQKSPESKEHFEATCETGNAYLKISQMLDIIFLERDMEGVISDLTSKNERKLLNDWAETDTAIRDMCRPILGDKFVDGSSNYVPSIEHLVEELCKHTPKKEN